MKAKMNAIHSLHVGVLGAVALLLAACAKSNVGTLTMAVGTYTDTGARGIYTYRFNSKTGQSLGLDTLAIANPSYLNFNSRGDRLYAVSENNEATDSVTAIRFDAAKGTMKPMNSLPTSGEAPCFVETNDHVLLVANYFGGSMSAFRLNPDGSLKQRFFQYLSFSEGPDSTRQETPHVHTTRFAPDGRHIIATDFSADMLSCFSFDENGEIGGNKEFYVLRPGSGPRHIEFSPDGKAMYVLGELSGAVTVLSYNDGKMQRLQEIQSDTVGARGSADIHLSPDGRFLYTSNRLKADGIRIFRVDPESHRLTSVGYQLTGAHPRNFSITPDGRWLLCACRDANVVELYRINAKTGKLRPTDRRIRLPHPVCVKFAPQK